MSVRLPFTFTRGTHRIVPPEQTLARIEPLLADCGITRCTDVTWLDQLGIPVYCAIRPAGLVLQVSNGKGMTAAAARASALMEAIELQHAETPSPGLLRWASRRELGAEGATVLGPAGLPGWVGGYDADGYRCEWIPGTALADGAPVWAPAGVACFARSPARLQTDSNGLASGNHLLEATLHGLYELIERDAVSAISVDGRLRVREHCRCIRHDSIPDAALRALLGHIESRDTQVVLLWVPSRVPVHTFWSVLLNHRPGPAVSTFNIGAGCHRDPLVALMRAVTEAAQSRLTFIHGAREDRGRKPIDSASHVPESAAFRYFARLEPTTPWSALPGVGAPEDALPDLFATCDWLVAELTRVGQRVYRFDLTRPEYGIPVVKLVAPGLDFNQRLF